MRVEILFLFALHILSIVHASWLRGGSPYDAGPIIKNASLVPLKKLSYDETYELQWSYLSNEKDWPYVGSDIYLSKFQPKTRHYYNSLAVFPNQSPYRLHGYLGIDKTGQRIYKAGPKPPAITDDNRDKALTNGGFYLNYSNYLPLDRKTHDQRTSVCKQQTYNLEELNDASIIITFFNEPISTLMRSVHSILNQTPPPILREIILVDDHSNTTELLPGGYLDEYLRFLPKLRQPTRRGLVAARLAGAQLARGPVLVILDSHIEVATNWLEPQLQRLKESPESIVFPQIPAIDPETFNFSTDSGIGCRLTFKWVMQEKSQGLITPEEPKATPSASMAGGLFAVNTDWFWELGGYDEEFSMWGAENVEMPFRAWMCGGRVECTPCAYVYHIYRKGGSGYKSPSQAIWKNRLRAARLWIDDFYALTAMFVGHQDMDIGPLDHMLELKKRLKCKNFAWFMKNVDTDQPIRNLNISIAGEIRSKFDTKLCIDTLSHSKPGEKYGTFYCHKSGGTQGFIRPADENLCLADDITLTKCQELNGHWILENNSRLIWSTTNKCLTLVFDEKTHEQTLRLEKCNSSNLAQEWTFQYFSYPQLSTLPPQ